MTELATHFLPKDKPKVRDGLLSQETVAVKALKDEGFAELPETDALSVALVLQQVMRGQDALLSRLEKVDKDNARLADELHRLQEYHARVELMEKRWENEREQLLTQWNDHLDGVDPKVREQAQARARQDLANTVQAVRAGRHVDRLRFESEIAEAPQVEIVRPGEYVLTRNGVKLLPETVQIKDHKWVFQPGVPQKVPDFVVRALEERDRSKAETAARADILRADNIQQDTDVRASMEKLNKDFGATMDNFPVYQE